MKQLLRLACILAGASFMMTPGSFANASVAKQAKAVNWADVVVRRPDGAVVIGNPRAPVKLTEYLSLTCTHCAAFSAEGFGPLRQSYIARGLVSLEVRHAVRDGYDMIASMLVRCQPASDYLPAIEAVFDSQRQWMSRAGAGEPPTGFETKPMGERLQIMGRHVGLDAMLAARGMTAKRYQACLNAPAEPKVLSVMAADAWDGMKIQGTPSFAINGALQSNVRTWSELEPLLKAAL